MNYTIKLKEVNPTDWSYEILGHDMAVLQSANGFATLKLAYDAAHEIVQRMLSIDIIIEPMTCAKAF